MDRNPILLFWNSLKSAAFLRTEMGRPAAAAVRTLLRCGTLFLLAISTYWTVRLAWADHLSFSGELAGRERAVELAPAIARFHEQLADKREELGLEFLPDLQRDASLDPENSGLRTRLGSRAEQTGNFRLAEESLVTAAARSNLYQPRYLLAQYYFRRQNTENFWKWLPLALEVGYGDVMALFDLAWRMQPDAPWIWQKIIPARPEIARQYLVFLAGNGSGRQLEW